MATPTIDRPGAARPPLLSVFAVRAELEPFADVRPFDREIDAAIEHAADTGSFDRLREALRIWLGIALQARHADEHVRLPRERRAEHQQELVDRWLQEHPEAAH